MALKLGVARSKREGGESAGAGFEFLADPGRVRELLHDAVMGVLGDEALRYLA
jgi:hypothetical protein